MKSFEIVIEKEETFDMYVVRTLKLKNLEKKDERIVYQFHFTGWPDHGVPDISNGKVFEIFCEINKKVDELNKGKDPIIVHYCDAEKPWFFESKHKFKDDFLLYAKLHDFIGFKPIKRYSCIYRLAEQLDKIGLKLRYWAEILQKKEVRKIKIS